MTAGHATGVSSFQPARVIRPRGFLVRRSPRKKTLTNGPESVRSKRLTSLRCTHHFRRALLCALVVACMGIMAWVSAAGETWSSAFQYKGRQFDYYSQLLRGLDRGHLYIPVTRDIYPNAVFPNGDQNGIFLNRLSAPLDTSYYHGRIYVYYGVVPVALMLWPYHALTGNDLSLNIPTFLFTAAGFIIFLSCYLRLRRLWFSGASLLVDVCAVLVLAFGSGTPFLVRRSMFYELPLAAGYCFLGLILTSLAIALTGARWPRVCLAVASLSVGLATGCHPNYIFLAPLVAVTAWWLWRDENPKTETASLQILRPSLAWSYLISAVIPAALVGAGLAWYNYARFGNPLEFGFNYGANEFFATQDRLRSASFIWTNINWYYFTPPSFLPYFPFCFPENASFRPPGYHGNEAIHGQFFATALMVWIGLGLLVWARGRCLQRAQLRIVILLTWSVFSSAIFILIMGIRANRYLVDFQAPLILLAVLCAAAVVHAASISGLRRAWQAGLALTSIALVVVSLLSCVQQFDIFLFTRPQTFERLSLSLNPSWAFWQRFGLVKPGGVLDFDVVFKQPKELVYEPLVTTGVPFYSDCIYAAQHPNGYLQFFLDHGSHGGPRGPMIRYETGKTYHLQIELGSFYPPKTDPSYSEWDVQSVSKVKTTLRVLLDGQPMLQTRFTFSESAPWVRLIGENRLTATLFSSTFSGEIKNLRWSVNTGIDPHADSANDRAFVRFKLTVPDYLPITAQPILMAGHSGAGALLILRPLGGTRWRWEIDNWNFEMVEGPESDLKPGVHEVALLIGPSLAVDPQIERIGMRSQSSSLRGSLVVWVDGRMLGKLACTRYAADFRHAKIGYNSEGFSSAETHYYGEVDTQSNKDDLVAQRLSEALSR